MKKKKGLDSLKIKEIQMQNTIFTYKLSEKRFQVMKIALELQKEYSGIVDRDVNWFKHSEVYFVTLYKKESLKNMQSFWIGKIIMIKSKFFFTCNTLYNTKNINK